MKDNIIINGEIYSIYRIKEDIIWKQHGEVYSISINNIKTEGNFGIVRMDTRDFIFEEELDLF
jgi:hypothetical protein